MLFEDVELDMSHVRLGDLTEYALMIMFGNAHSHQLVFGTDVNPGQIKDEKGNILYPAYFYTSLRVPEKSLLRTYKLWQKVRVGVEVKRFGETLLESNYVLDKQLEIGGDTRLWDKSIYPTMYGNNLIVVDTAGEQSTKRKVSNPKKELIANLEKSTKPPAGIAISKQVRSRGIDSEYPGFQFSTAKPISYKVIQDRDACDGHAMIFAEYCRIMDYAEKDLLCEQLEKPTPHYILANACVVERDIIYYGNCYVGEILDIRIKGSIEKIVAEDSRFDELDYIPAAYLNVTFEIVQQRNNVLLAISHVKKIIAIPMKEQELVADIDRLFSI